MQYSNSEIVVAASCAIKKYTKVVKLFELWENAVDESHSYFYCF